eukprot:TRINITY_DN54702_c0_g1_i1.p1 TRINITY_DN54702_c0_g1~~TRINITY_DN54702_c0_g1_i1.p1  ORF type:complete len:587 (+),score=95.85 TRINITY_DN54702_c0_g1_i1:22-1761(+)
MHRCLQSCVILRPRKHFQQSFFCSRPKFGGIPLSLQTPSWDSPGRPHFTSLGDLSPEQEGSTVTVRARVQTIRSKGNKLVFLVLRDTPHTVQAVLATNPKLEDGISTETVKWVSNIPSESVVDVEALVCLPPKPVAGTSLPEIELKVVGLQVISSARKVLPFQYEDAARPEPNTADCAPRDTETGPRVELETRLNNRWLDLRTPQNNAVFRLKGVIAMAFRTKLQEKGFAEIHTPKLLGAASEGGSAVFRADYFGRPCFLAQSPQLYKQMAVMGDLSRVYEVGPVFRAEQSNTHRHLTEFVGLDAEQIIRSHYFEVLDTLEDTLLHIFKTVQTEHQDLFHRARFPGVAPLVSEVDFGTIRKRGMRILSEAPNDKVNPTESGAVSCLQRRVLRLPYTAGVALLNHRLGLLARGSPAVALEMLRMPAASTSPQQLEQLLRPIPATEDLSTCHERLLGAIVKEEYGVDFYVLHRYPSTVRPFYTMPALDDPAFSNSFDAFVRGEEIISGGQRIHDADLLERRAKECGVDVQLVADYISSFRLGAHPHGGFGAGLERVVMLLLGLQNVRRASMFPRDPQRLSP